MSTLTAASFTDLEHRGFVVIPSLLSRDEVEALQRDYESQPAASNDNYSIKNASPAANARLAARVSEVLARVVAETNLRTNVPQGGAYFATGIKAGINFAWHQDHESFFLLQNHYDYLNFYIPIVKPRVDKSNLSIVPFDALEREGPKAFKALARGGASRFVRLFGTQVAILDDSGAVCRLDVDLNRIALTPQLSAGDCLLLRGDIVHRTQDAETERVAFSFRVSSTEIRINRARLAGGSLHKARMMAGNPVTYARLFTAFDALKKPDATLQELSAAVKSMSPDTPPSSRTFMRYLLRQKLRSGTLPRFVVSVAATSALDIAKRASTFYDRRVGAGA